MAIVNLLPNANGSVQQWDSFSWVPQQHWQCVDDPVGSPNEDTDYVHTDVINEIEDFHHATSPLLTGATITNVRVYVRARATTAFLTAINIGIKIGVTRHAAALNTNLTQLYVTYSKDWATKPPFGVPWTKADIDSLQSSLEMWSHAITARVTQVYLAITYTPAVTPVAGKGLVSWTP